MRMSLCRCAVTMLALLVTACAGPRRLTDPVHHTSRRSRQLMVLAAGEARLIPDADVRLTRQLNIANEILSQHGKDGAVEALHHATETLTTVGRQLSGHALLAGWVSVAQLARRSSSDALATEAAGRAVNELERIPDPAERCDYVMGVAEEVSHSIGSPSAATLLMKSGDWAAAIIDSSTRRSARLAFASALFNLEDYEAGTAVLRKENDPLWSSDAMVSLASPGSFVAMAGKAPRDIPVIAVESRAASDSDYRAPPPAAASQSYGKELGFQSVFEGRTSSTAKR